MAVTYADLVAFGFAYVEDNVSANVKKQKLSVKRSSVPLLTSEVSSTVPGMTLKRCTYLMSLLFNKLQRRNTVHKKTHRTVPAWVIQSGRGRNMEVQEL